jgi:hypothetical protein
MKVDYIYDKAFFGVKDKGPLRWDFVLYPDSDTTSVIEYDGEFHTKIIRMGSQTQEQAQRAYEGTVRRDKIKDDYADENGICMMRIPYTDFKYIDQYVREFVENTRPY